MPVDIFMVIPAQPTGAPGLPQLAGDPVQDDYFSRIYGKAVAVVELRSFSLDVENPTTVGSMTGGAGAGKAKLNPLSVEKVVDRTSPSLFVISASGAHFPTVQVFVRKAGSGGPQAGRPYLAYEFSMVFITDISWSAGTGDDVPVEQVTFAYGGLTVGYGQQSPDGSIGKPTKLGWDQVNNKSSSGDALTSF